MVSRPYPASCCFSAGWNSGDIRELLITPNFSPNWAVRWPSLPQQTLNQYFAMNLSSQLIRLPVTITTCHAQHKLLKGIIQRQEEEIAQLRSVLIEVMEQYNCRSLRHDAIDYYRDLNQLQSKLDRLQRDMICESTHCPVTPETASCSDTRFGVSVTIDRHSKALMREFLRIKDGCLQFLNGMMSLNLI